MGSQEQPFEAEGLGNSPQTKGSCYAEVPLQPTGAKNTSDVKLEILEIFAKAKIDKIDNFSSLVF